MSLYVRNLTNKRYLRNIAVQAPSAIGYPGDPLTAGINVFGAVVWYFWASGEPILED